MAGLEDMTAEVSGASKETEAVHWDRGAILTDRETLLDLATFFGMEAALCQARLDEYRMSEMANEWRRVDPKTPTEIRRFYEGTELYIWELCKWHADETYRGYRKRVAQAIELFPRSTHPRVLDFGAGIATASLEFARAGYQVTLADVPGKTLAFAKHRFQRRGLRCSVIEVTEDIPNLPRGFDVVISFDVFEHIPNAEKIMNRLVRSLRVGGAAVIVASFEDHGEHPQHLSGNIARFKRFAWEWALVGAGLRFHPSGLLTRASAGYAVPRKIRWFLHAALPFLPWRLLYRATDR
jgi:SAM-dependent methyltransferase